MQCSIGQAVGAVSAAIAAAVLPFYVCPHSSELVLNTWLGMWRSFTASDADVHKCDAQSLHPEQHCAAVADIRFTALQLRSTSAGAL